MSGAKSARKPSGPYLFVTNGSPAKVLVYETSSSRWLATFTVGASSVCLAGPTRVFAEATAANPVTHTVWVRTLPAPFAGTVNTSWMSLALQANQNGVPDILEIGMQYIDGEPPILDGNLQIAGDASYGPLQSDGTRQEGSDFNDYLGLAWIYADGLVDQPESTQFRCLDCSGFMRMVWGYRHSFLGSGFDDSIPLTLDPLADHSALPRRAYQMCEAAPGIVVVPNNGTTVSDFSTLQPGDLVFFDASVDDGDQIDHVGMYLGLDAGRKHRFLSSRKSIDGPTLGDYRGYSILNGTGLCSTSFRSVRRL